METKGQLRLYTVESRWLNDAHHLRAIPYERVVAAETKDDFLWATILPRRDTRAAYDMRSAAIRDFEVSEVLAARFMSFFSTFYTGLAQPGHSFNCHRFAHWMQGLRSGIYYDGFRGANRHIYEGQDVTGVQLSLGQHAVIGSVSPEYEHRSIAQHSVIGIGDEENTCMQVMESDGYIGIETAQTVVQACEVTYDMPDARMYSAA